MSQHALTQIVRKSGELTDEIDAQLIARFVGTRDEAAFRVLVQRHGPAVLTALRQVLTDPADIDDAFQATFLVLFKRATRSAPLSVPLRGWLFGVAHRVAVRCRADRHRRTVRETEAARRAQPTTELPDLSWREATEILHQELNALPDKYRLPLLLCGVQGLTRDEAADQLGTSPGALRGHLDRGRALLEKRLARRGIVLSTGWLALVIDSSRAVEVPSARLIDLAARVTAGQSARGVTALAAGVLPVNRLLKPFTLTITVLLIAVGLGFGFASIAPQADEKPVPKAAAPAPRAEKATLEPAPKEDTKELRTITGKVLDATGKPVPAELSLVWSTGAPEPLGRAGADGTFALTVRFKRNGSGGRFVAKAPGHGMDFRPHGLSSVPESMSPAVEWTLKLPKERAIRGRVLDHEGTAVAGATVVANFFSACDTEAAMDRRLEEWAAREYHGAPPSGDRTLWFPDADRTRGSPDERSPYTATTDKDGRFEITGAGVNQLVGLRIRGAGFADKELVTLNRIGFNPTALNQVARNSESKDDSYAGKWALHGPAPLIILEPEKLIRGRVTDPAGKPRVGVMVRFSRTNKNDLNPDENRAVTGPDGRYEIRGARKHKGYMVEIPPDPDAGLLPCQGFAEDTPKYEPVTIDLKCAKGVVVTGTVTNKATGKPLAAELVTRILADNPFVDRYPPFLHSASQFSTLTQPGSGRFRLVTVPGPVILMAGPQNGKAYEFKPPVPDPNFANRFNKEPAGPSFKIYGGGAAYLWGCWCLVLDAKPTDGELTVNVELEPAPRTLVKVVDTDGKPVTGVIATGITAPEHSFPGLSYLFSFPDTDTVSVFNQEPGKDRLLVAGHVGRELVGALVLKTGDKSPIVTLGPGGRITGRAVDENGRPLAGLKVEAFFLRSDGPVRGTWNLGELNSQTTGNNGEFQIDTMLPGHSFLLVFRQEWQFYQPVPQPERSTDWGLNGLTIAKHGDTLTLGDIKLRPQDLPGRGPRK
ncbi:sigma-70 family RNA polymerase sigma factor [Gemmata sp. G18]|uniref:Sigma-70 family RNA polymerase sigma factor n=1 Tax=Gemmata palustris TaxID=2822762 RepID=A0ABS5BMG5_9BACT|nr:sigma-70 family RNA polymerase sigma factor [Gemmata palustris]MBP3954891.1 sigma-70 family RNA polymerase sigma factor [Gemmata palustris]